MKTYSIAVYAKKNKKIYLHAWTSHEDFMSYVNNIMVKPRKEADHKEYEEFLYACENKIDWQYNNKEFKELIAIKFMD